ncbi:hypothetical protein PsYK624_128910 [Phanerochaete sordida]|uniref:Uncharacterized protein n=1 Tax=Phanerochaete sordida TaxID=48140 RepID=A0A9P3LJY6_9APHY|nr:hypothetical protein PsYK624_128910 [Phanerochaete sordida]
MSTGFTHERESRLDAVNTSSRLRAGLIACSNQPAAHPARVGYKSSSEDLRQVELGSSPTSLSCRANCPRRSFSASQYSQPPSPTPARAQHRLRSAALSPGSR